MNLQRSKARALAGLAVYGWACLALPALHEWRHADDHVHGADGSLRYFAHDATPEDPNRVANAAATAHVDDTHEAFDSDLDALGLLDVGHAGIALVDCSLARYTLAACDGPPPPALDPARSFPAGHTFGDELVARLPHTHSHPHSGDPNHGLHSAAHFGLAVLAVPTFLLPPPSLPLVATAEARPIEHAGFAPACVLRVRGPPSRIG